MSIISVCALLSAYLMTLFVLGGRKSNEDARTVLQSCQVWALVGIGLAVLAK